MAPPSICSSLAISLSFDCFLFFFSSRRRHTRLTCDWSSDVCSSDLREPTGEELAEALGLLVADVRELLALRAQRVVSLHVLPQMQDDDGDEGRLPSDEVIWFAAEHTSPAPGAIAAGFDRLHEALDQLPMDERRVVALRYGFVDGREHSQREVAELVGLPCSLVPVLDRRARFHLRRLLSGAGWDRT